MIIILFYHTPVWQWCVHWIVTYTFLQCSIIQRFFGYSLFSYRLAEICMFRVFSIIFQKIARTHAQPIKYMLSFICQTVHSMLSFGWRWLFRNVVYEKSVPVRWRDKHMISWLSTKMTKYKCGIYSLNSLVDSMRTSRDAFNRRSYLAFSIYCWVRPNDTYRIDGFRFSQFNSIKTRRSHLIQMIRWGIRCTDRYFEDEN